MTVAPPSPGSRLQALIDRMEDAERLKALVNAPEIDLFLRGSHLEAVHQVERWGDAHDRAKRPADWFWLVGYLAGKALHSAVDGNFEKAKHHCISTAGALYNWHCAISGADVRMCPGRSDLAEMVESLYPGETAPQHVQSTKQATLPGDTLAELRVGLRQIAARVADDPVMAKCCRLIDEKLAGALSR